jgi:TRAP-type uncharacterized transport system substrate-binding protein
MDLAGSKSPQRPATLRGGRGLVALLAVLGAALAALLVSELWQPAPPKRVVMSTGAPDGAYHAYALRYRQVLAREGVDLVLKPSGGAIENLQRLRTREGGVVVTLLQGGTVPRDADDFAIGSLGGVFYEAVWVFCRCAVTDDDVFALAGLRVAIGAEGSGSQPVARLLLGQLPARAPMPQPVAVGGVAAAQALQRGELQAVIMVASPDAPAVQQMLREPGVRLVNFQRAEAWERRFPQFTRLILPTGAIDLAQDIPPADVQLLGLTASLGAASDLHPVIVDLLLRAAREVHGNGSVLWRPGQFPNPQAPELPLDIDAERFFKSGPSLLQRYLPLWVAAWVERALFIVLPLLAVGLPLMRLLPGVYRWSMRRRIYRWYGELSYIERAVLEQRGDRTTHIRRLDDIERRIAALRVPPAFAGEAYMLKMHLQLVRGRVGGTDAASA